MKTRALICASVLLFGACETEESYQGRSVSELLNRLNSSDSKVHVESHEALTHIVPRSRRAIEVLARALTDSNPEIREAAAKTLANADEHGRERLRKSIHHSNTMVREGAAIALGAFKSSGAERELDIAALAEALDDQEGQVRSAAARAAMGRLSLAPSPAAERALLRLDSLSRDKDPSKRQRAVDLISALAPERRSTWTAVRRSLADPSHLVRESGAIAAGRLVGIDSSGEQTSVTLLRQALRDVSPHVRARAAIALGEAGAGIPSAIAALGQSRRDADSTVRTAAASALEAMTLACRRRPTASRCVSVP